MAKRTDDILKETFRIRDTIRRGLESIKTENGEASWYEEYLEWKQRPGNQILFILTINDPLMETGSYGDSYIPDRNNELHMADVEIKQMSFFVFERFRKHERSTVESIYLEKNPDNKVKNIKAYFDSIYEYAKNLDSLHTLAELDHLSKINTVIIFNERGAKELYPRYILFEQMLRRRSVEAIYLLYTLWRITKEKKYYKKLIISIEKYIKDNFSIYDNDPHMKLSISLQNVHFTERLRVIAHWLTRIASISIDRFELYESKGWIVKTNYIAENNIVIPWVSPYQLYMVGKVLKGEKKEIICQKATAYYAHNFCVKSIDVFTVFKDIFRILLNYDDETIIRQRTTRNELLEIYSKLTQARNAYLEALFKNSCFYDQENKKYDIARLEEQENASISISGSVEDFLKLTQDILDENIEGLLASKQRFIKGIACYLSIDKIATIEEFLSEAIQRLKERVQEEDGYIDVYDSIIDELAVYSTLLSRHPQIYSTLASAEYLHKEYIIKRKRDNFDYSCIAILYFLSLEDVLNKLIYVPYKKEVLSGHENDKNLNQYLHRPQNYKKDQNFKNACELGPLGYLLKCIENEPFFKSYMTEKYTNANSSTINKLGNRIVNIAPKRNNAAHSDVIVTYGDVTQDKMEIYDNSRVGHPRGLVIDILDLLNKKKARP